MVESTSCTCREPCFSSWYPNGSSEPSAIAVLGDLMPLDLCGHQAQMWYPYIYVGKRFIHIKNKIKSKSDYMK